MSKPTLMETTLGVFLHDIGKFLQRAHKSNQELTPGVRNLDSTILPSASGGGYSHWHALWTEEFFQRLERQGKFFPAPVRLHHVRTVAVFHHKPDSKQPWTWIAAEADRLSAGMERKERDEQLEREDVSQGRDRFIRTALLNPLGQVNLLLGKPSRTFAPLEELTPGDQLYPQASVALDTYPMRYRSLWQAFESQLHDLLAVDSPDVFCEGLLSLSERFLWAVPSSTIDEPDISLHDHSRIAASIAAAMYLWHEQEASLENEAAICNREIQKFQLLTGDLSGIQSSLYLLSTEQVRGASRILRARSFLLSMLVEAGALAARQRFGLPVFSLWQNAGGQFRLLIPNRPDAQAIVDELQREFDRWIYDRYWGAVSLNLALSRPFNANQLTSNLREILADARAALEDAKRRPLRHVSSQAVRTDGNYHQGACKACGLRPASHVEARDNEEVWRCQSCHEESRIGRRLPQLKFLIWSEQNQTQPPAALALDFFAGLRLELTETLQPTLKNCLSAIRVYQGEQTAPGPIALRFLANYVPQLKAEETNKPAYRHLSEEAQQTKPDEIKTFEHLALDGVRAVAEELLGAPLLAVLKADVDRLGLIFSSGLKPLTPSRWAAASRMLDFFFSGQLPELLRRDFPSVYTVYAGGDDLLLIGPWEQTVRLAIRLRQLFAQWTGNNPNITLSAGVELIKPHHPIHRAAEAADERLENSKDSGRDRVCAFDRVALSWGDFESEIRRGEQLAGYLEQDTLSQAFVHRILYFDEQKQRAERHKEVAAANWRARWGYQLARQLGKKKETKEGQELMRFLNQLLGLDADLKAAGSRPVSARTAVSFALYRNRKGVGRE